MFASSGHVGARGALSRAFVVLCRALVMTVASAIAACGGGGGGGGSSPPPQISITAQPADVHVLAGQSATFTVGTTGSVTYEWQRKISSAWTDVAGGNAAALTLTGLSTADSGSDFRVIVASRANPANSLTSSVVALTVDPVQVAPTIVAPPVDATVVEGNTATFSVTASGTSLGYQWQHSADGSTWADVPGATTTAWVSTVAIEDDGTLVRVVVSNSLGTQTSTTAHLRVTPAPVAPTFTTQPVAAVVTVGQVATFNAVATGVPAPTLQWMSTPDGVTWTPIAGAQAGSYTTAATTAQDDGRLFKVVASNGVGPGVDSQVVRLTVNPAPAAPVITAQPADATLALNSSATSVATLSVTATGVPAPSYQWQISADGGVTFTNVNDATSATYLFAPHSDSADGTRLRVVVSNVSGTVTSRAATIAVMNYPTAKLVRRAVWQSGTAMTPLTASATGGQLHYRWTISSTSLGQQDAQAADSPVFVLPATSPPDTYSVCVTASNALGSAIGCTAITAVRWSLMAPKPTDEHLHAAAWLDANTVLAGGGVGTILRSADAGLTWTPVFNAGVISVVVRSFASMGDVTLAVGDQGFGARSTDGGRSWTQIDTLDNLLWFGVAFDDSGRAIEVGGINNGAVRTSVDQGVTWQDATLPTGGEVFTAVAVNHAGVALAGGLNGVLARSTDRGQTWTETHIAGHQLNALAFASDTVAIAAGDYGEIHRSTDAGQTWTSVASPTPYAISGVRFSTASVGVATTLQGPFLRTIDGGLTWTLAGTDPGLAGGYFAANFAPDGQTVVAVGNLGSILRSTDAGQSYARATTGASAVPLLGVAFRGANGIAVGNAGIERSADGGTTWTAPSPASQILNAVAYAGPSTVLVGGYAGLVMRSTDGGTTWSTSATPGTDTVDGLASNGGGVAVAATGTGMWRSTDGGVSWTRITGPTDWMRAVTFLDATTAVAVSSNDTVYRSTDAGATWTLATRPTFALWSVAAASATTVVAVGDGGHAIRSTDGGATWQDVSPGFGLSPIEGIAFSSASDGVMVGRFIYRTTDGGVTWVMDNQVSDSGMVDVAISGGRAVAVGASGTILRSDPL